MRTLVYKRTHHGDPDEDGCFGIHDCMGTIRAREYDAVIGVGGLRPWSGHEDIAERINWIGIGPKKIGVHGRGPLVTFEHFLFFGGEGPKFTDHAPRLAAHIYGSNVRSKMVESDEDSEVRNILALAKGAAASRARRSKPPGSGTCAMSRKRQC